jgi:hypothetical protein
MRLLLFILFSSLCLADQPQPPKTNEPANTTVAPQPAEQYLNLLGKTDTQGGEAKRNDNVSFDLVDNNALKEQNSRLGTSATVIQDFLPQHSYFGVEFGNPPSPVLHTPAVALLKRWHGALRAKHQNSIFNARRFFQVGPVQPAHENEYSADLTAPLGRNIWITLSGLQQKVRGNVNGNVLVPLPTERVPLTTDPAKRAIIDRWLQAYPLAPPNRTDIDERALNTNAPQSINTDNASGRIDAPLGPKNRLAFRHAWTTQQVRAFEFVAGQNPWTTTKSHNARLTFTRTLSATAVTDLTAGFDRTRSLLVPEPNAVGPAVEIGTTFTKLGPGSNVPLDRFQNRFRFAGTLRHSVGNHQLVYGGEITRLQFNGREASSNRGNWYFKNDFGRDAVTNFLLGIPSRYSTGLGLLDRGFRNWEQQYYFGDSWKATPSLTLNYGVRYQPVTVPYEVNGLTDIPIRGDHNNFAPRFGIAHRLPRSFGVLRANYGLEYGEFYAVTFQQLRWNPPEFLKVEVQAPDLLSPLGDYVVDENARSTIFALSDHLRTPYAHMYSFSWEFAPYSDWKIQLGYTGSRSHKLFMMWHTNRAIPVPGIPLVTATINDRRPDPNHFEIRRVENGSNGYFDAARVSVQAPNVHGLSIDAAYWFGKALDTGSAYSNTAAGDDSRQGQSQTEYLVQQDLKQVSDFDQSHALLVRARYQFRGPRTRAAMWARNWTVTTIYLAKSGLPFTVMTGSDSPGYGNVDGSSYDRPNVVDPAILGRFVTHPDTAQQLLPRSAFAYLAPGQVRGNLGQNTFRRGGISNLNLALSRIWTLPSERYLTFRAEAINAANTPQFAEPITDLTNPAFGKITNTLNDGRNFALTLELRF